MDQPYVLFEQILTHTYSLLIFLLELFPKTFKMEKYQNPILTWQQINLSCLDQTSH